jgi:hypothetical protein
MPKQVGERRADLGLEEEAEASQGKAPQAAAGRSSRMPQWRNQSSPPSAGGRDMGAVAVAVAA